MSACVRDCVLSECMSGLYVRATQKGYIRMRKAQSGETKKEKNRKVKR